MCASPTSMIRISAGCHAHIAQQGEHANVSGCSSPNRISTRDHLREQGDAQPSPWHPSLVTMPLCR